MTASPTRSVSFERFVVSGFWCFCGDGVAINVGAMRVFLARFAGGPSSTAAWPGSQGGMVTSTLGELSRSFTLIGAGDDLSGRGDCCSTLPSSPGAKLTIDMYPSELETIKFLPSRDQQQSVSPA